MSDIRYSNVWKCPQGFNGNQGVMKRHFMLYVDHNAYRYFLFMVYPELQFLNLKIKLYSIVVLKKKEKTNEFLELNFK